MVLQLCRSMKFKLVHLLLALTFVAVVLAHINLLKQLREIQLERDELKKELDSSRPVQFVEVQRQLVFQLQKYAKVRILGMAYDPLQDDYDVGIYWEEKSEWVGNWYKFKGNRAGEYVAELLHEPFAKQDEGGLIIPYVVHFKKKSISSR
jgi:hypothetical protein